MSKTDVYSSNVTSLDIKHTQQELVSSCSLCCIYVTTAVKTLRMSVYFFQGQMVVHNWYRACFFPRFFFLWKGEEGEGLNCIVTIRLSIASCLYANQISQNLLIVYLTCGLITMSRKKEPCVLECEDVRVEVKL